MRNIDIYKVEHVSRTWFTDNWGVGQYVHGYPYDTHKDVKGRDYKHPSHEWPTRCTAWIVLAVGA